MRVRFNQTLSIGGKSILLLLFVGASALAVISAPDLRRYQRIRNM